MTIPEYTYRCQNCGLVFQDSAVIADRNKLKDCDECECMAVRDVEAEMAAVGKRVKWITENERWSRSMGIPRKQLAEFRKRFPNSTYDDKGRLLIKSRSDKMRQAKERGFVELDDEKN